MRILHVVPTFFPAVAYGGPIYSLLHLCRNLSDIGCDIRVVTTDANGASRLTPGQQGDPALGPLAVHYCRRLGSGMAAPHLLRRVYDQSRWADLIHLTAVYNFPTVPTLLVAAMRGKPLVWSPRGTLQRWSGSRRLAAKALWESMCRAVMPQRLALHVTSEQEAAESAPRLGNPPSVSIPNGVEIPPLPSVPECNGLLKLLFIGRIDPKKGLDNLISSAILLSRSGFTAWHLTIAGSGHPSYVESLRKLTSNGGIADKVEFTGHLEGHEKYLAFSHCDVVVVPSHTENFGNVVAEALAHARPVITSRGTPWAEVQARQCGLWIDNTPSSLACAIRQIDGGERLAMGERGRAWMTASFSWHVRARQMLALYEHLLAA